MGVQKYNLYKLLKSCSDEPVVKYIKKRREKIKCNPYFLSLVSNHFQKVLRHRKWVIHMFYFISGVLSQEERNGLYERILHHDLSKFSAVESIGYTIKFHRKNGVQNDREKKSWDLAFYHHCTHNDHHPEFFKMGDMNHCALLESIIDMLACRIEKDIEINNVTVHSILDIPKKYLERYTIADKKKVSKYLIEWGHVLIDGLYINYLRRELTDIDVKTRE